MKNFDEFLKSRVLKDFKMLRAEFKRVSFRQMV